MKTQLKQQIVRALLVVFILGNIILILTGKMFFYKALLYNFANIDDNKIFDQRTIQKSTQPQPWPQSIRYNKTLIAEKLKAYHESEKSIAFVVLKNDSLVHEEYWSGYGENSLSNSFSMGKSVTSILVGIAIKEGKIKSVDQPIGDFLEEFNQGKFKHIKIRHLLTMSSGLNWDESYANPLSMTTEAYYGSDLWRLMLRLRVIDQPGIAFKYLSGDTQLLSFVLSKATGKSLSEYAQEKLWKPIGAVNNAEWSLDQKGGHEKAYCCMYSNAKDFARIGALYLHHGKWNGKQLLDSAYIEASLSPAKLIDSESGKPNDFYGFQWWLIPDYKGDKIFYARGILGQMIIVVPAKQLVIVRLGNKKPEKIGNHYKAVFDMIDVVNSQVK
jgi:CubicO group peptidase (beta-lactamase class C family)